MQTYNAGLEALDLRVATEKDLEVGPDGFEVNFQIVDGNYPKTYSFELIVGDVILYKSRKSCSTKEAAERAALRTIQSIRNVIS